MIRFLRNDKKLLIFSIMIENDTKKISNFDWKHNFELVTNLLAPMETASFFVIAIAEKFNGLLHFVRNDKKDIVDSGK